MTSSTLIRSILHDVASSYWLRAALTDALARDPVDAARDAELLATVLHARCDEALNGVRDALG